MRHVKCDENKPACKQCLRTRRTCDGYDTNQAMDGIGADICGSLVPHTFCFIEACITQFIEQLNL